MTNYLFALVLSVLAATKGAAAHNHGNGMDMSMDGGKSLPIGQMLCYLHFTPGDNVLFLGWVPKSAGATVGTCLGLFMLAVIERWIAACRAMMELHWGNRARIMLADKTNHSDVSKTTGPPTLWDDILLKTAPSFVPSFDLLRGIFQIGQSALAITFMLVAMTFQASFILSLALGAGFGEMLFGRYIV